VTLQSDYVLKEYNPVEMNKHLNSLPTTPTDAYQKTLERMPSKMRDFACQILGWILHAQRVLTMDELREVLAIEAGVASLDPDSMPAPDLVVRTCGGLIAYEQGNGLVRFSHETVRRFLNQNELGNLPSHSDICKTCLTYLRLPPLEKPCGHDWYEYDKRIEEFKLSEYAARFWASHAVETETKRNVELETAILDTFSRDGRREAMEELRYRYYDTKQKSLLHVLIENQLAFIFMNPVSKAEYRMYFLILFKLIVRVTELVLPNRAINALDGLGATPLHYAARNGYLDAVKFLVQEAGADVESKDGSWGQTPLSWPAVHGRLDAVKFLVKEAGADVESKDGGGRTPLSWAAYNGELEAVEFLAKEAGADVEAKDEGGRTPLSWAAVRSRLEVVKFLAKEAGADVEAKDEGERTPLSYVAANGHLETVEFLAKEAGADVEAKDGGGQTPLSRAAVRGRLEAVKFLVKEAGADVESKDRRWGQTPLSYAAVRGHLEVVKFLVEEAGADVDSKDKGGKTALDLARREGARESRKEEECRAVAAWLEAVMEKKARGEAGS
jgi:ankyrin repeat protein